MNQIDPSATGLNFLLLSLSVLIIFYNCWNGWRQGVVRQICRVIAILAGYCFGLLLGPMLAPLLTFIDLPTEAVKWIACLGVGLIIYLGLKLLTNVLFRKTREQESTIIRLIYGFGGSAIGLLFSAVFLLFLIVAIRSLGTIGEAQMMVAEQRREPLPASTAKFIPPLVRVKKNLEKGVAGPVIEAVDPTPETVYLFLNKVGRVTSDPEAMRRFMDFPGSRVLAEQPIFQDLARDPLIQKHLQQRDFGALMENSKVQAALQDEKLRAQLSRFEFGKALDYALAVPAGIPATQPAESDSPPVEQY